MTKEFSISKMIGLHAQSKNSLALLDNNAYVACVGAGAAVFPLDPDNSDTEETFFYEPPTPGHEASPSTSPRASPELKPVGITSSPNSARLIRVNKSHCLDVSSHRKLLAVGEFGGYKPRILLYDLRNGNFLDVVNEQHEFGVQFLKFSPSGTHLVSLGTPHDGYLYIWSVKNGKLTMKHSSRCISEIHDLVWLNDQQIITVGKRHVKVWTLDLSENTFSGRSIILDNLVDQVFECALPLASPDRAEFLVSTTKGGVYQMPDLRTLIPESGKPVKSLAFAQGKLFLSTASQILVYDDTESFDKPTFSLPTGSPALYSTRSKVFYIEILKHATTLRQLDPVQLDSAQPAPVYPEYTKILQRRGLQLRSTASGSVLCWNNDESKIVRWPKTVIDTQLKDITVADEAGSSSLLAGSLSGDISLDGVIISAHDGPISDVHVFSPQLSISCSRDRSVQIWTREDESSSWILKQTLLFATPILKARLCEGTEGQMALVCCGVNKTLYSYTTKESISFSNDGTSAFSDPPRTLFVRGTPYDLISFGRRLILSTNDKIISTLDPFGNDLLSKTWRPRDSNGEPVNLTHLTCVQQYGEPDLLVGTGSNKCILAFNLDSGEMVACLWGFGEPLSGLASAGRHVIGSSDVVLVSELNEARTKPASEYPSVDLSPPGLKMAKLQLSSDNSVASPDRMRSPSPTPRRAVRRVFQNTASSRSRSVSPVRSNKPSSPPRVSARPSLADSFEHPPPLKLSSPLRLAQKSAAQNIGSSQSAAQNLTASLKAFMNSPQAVADSEKEELKQLMISALNKVDGLALFEHLTQKLEAKLDAKFDSLKTT